MKLTIHGASNITVDVTPSAFEETGPGGVQMTVGGLHEGPLTVQFTRLEAAELIRQVAEAMAEETP